MNTKQKALEIINKFKKQIIIGSCVIIIFTICLILVVNNSEENITHENLSEIVLNKPVEEETFKKVYVDIKGYIVNPGVYEVNEGTIINDVILLAGGLKKGADTKHINLSKRVIDEMVIIVYSIDEVLGFKEEEIVEEEVLCEESINDACIQEESYSYFSSININNDNYISESNISKTNNLININTATIEQLDALPDIGPSIAKRIIEYRETNGLFILIEDIMEVSGIGEKTFNKLKDLITT